MTPGARVEAAVEILDTIITEARSNGPPADRVIGDWFKTRRYAGSGDRRAIREIVWGAIRAHGDPPAHGRAAIERSATDPLPRWFRDSAPDWLDGDEAAALVGRAPLDIRVNPASASVSDVTAAFPDATPITKLEFGVRLPETPALEAHELFRSGAIEVQDAGSQHVARLAAAKPGETVVDLCAGAGGKTLALAADMAGEGRLIACDVDRARLSKLAPRATRAGVAVESRLLDPGRELAALSDLEAQADLVLIDAPCTGSGTWRRSPDLRWRMSAARADRIEATQRQIVEYAQKLVRPGGRLVYAVCSVRDQEARAIDGWEVMTPDDIGRRRGAGRLLTPFHDKTDGFFIAVLRKAC